MTLSALIRKRDTGGIATAIPATSAIREDEGRATVARIATVAVANPKGEQNAPPAIVGAGDTATHAEILERHPDAVAAEPFEPTITPPIAPLSREEEAAIRAWLALIEETDPEVIEHVIEQCRLDAEARRYFLGLAEAELPKPEPLLPDDRRTCAQCTNLVAGRCQAARRGEIIASRNYEPIRDLPRRCEGCVPGPGDQDRRTGAERWPG